MTLRAQTGDGPEARTSRARDRVTERIRADFPLYTPTTESPPMNKKLYAIIDLLANDLAGPLQVFAADEAAIRFFGDVINAGDNMVAKHPEDHILARLGTVANNTAEILAIIPSFEIVITGKQFMAAQQRPTDQLSLGAE